MNLKGTIVKHLPSEHLLYILVNNVIHICKYNNFIEKTYGRYFVNKMHLDFNVHDEPKEIEGKSIYRLTEIFKIYYIHNRKEISYYDIGKIKTEIADLLNQKEKRLFFDLELSMHPFYKTNDFVQEIIQCGYVLEDENGEIIEKNFLKIKPFFYPIVSKRTISFLNVTQEEVDSGLSVNEFHEHLLDLMTKHQAKIYVWGRNDFLALDNFYQMHNLVPATSRKDFVNLLQLYKTYHQEKNEKGLFKCIEDYGKKILVQSHNPLEDALITKDIFHFFKEEVNSKL